MLTITKGSAFTVALSCADAYMKALRLSSVNSAACMLMKTEKPCMLFIDLATFVVSRAKMSPSESVIH